MDKTITNILIPCQQHSSTHSAIAIGADLARRFRANLHLLMMEGQGRELRPDDFTSEVKKHGGPNPVVHPCKGNSLKDLLHCSKDIHADLIVAGMDGKETGGMFQRSAAFKLACMSDCPVLAVPESPARGPFNKILVHLDASTETRQKLGIASAIAGACHSEVHVFGASREKDNQSAHHLDVFCNQAEKYFKERGLRTVCSSASGVKIGETVKEQAEKVNAGLVVMMTETEPAGFLATPYTEWVMNQQTFPVLAMRPRETRVAGGGL
jgi:nucleotide-binding universal stress UspA family protein